MIEPVNVTSLNVRFAVTAEDDIEYLPTIPPTYWRLLVEPSVAVITALEDTFDMVAADVCESPPCCPSTPPTRLLPVIVPAVETLVRMHVPHRPARPPTYVPAELVIAKPFRVMPEIVIAVDAVVPVLCQPNSAPTFPSVETVSLIVTEDNVMSRNVAPPDTSLKMPQPARSTAA